MFFILVGNHYLNVTFLNFFLKMSSNSDNYSSLKKNLLQEKYTKITYFNKMHKRRSIPYSIPTKIENKVFLDDILGYIYIKYQWLEYFLRFDFVYLNYNDEKNVFSEKIYLKLNFFKKKFFLKKNKINFSEINLSIFDKYNDMRNLKPKLFFINKFNKIKFFKKKLNFFKKSLQKVKNIGIFFKKFNFSKLIALRRHFYLKKKYFNVINLFLINFLNFFLKKKFFLVLTKLNRLVKFVDKKKLLFYIFYVVKRKIKRFKTLKYAKIFYKILYLSLKLKDSQFFLKWFNNQMELLDYKKHKNLVHILYTFFKNYQNYIFLHTNIKGIFFSIKGKIGVTGNSKKRHIYLSYGRHSSSSKNLKVNSFKSQVKTKTGVMGTSFSIFF